MSNKIKPSLLKSRMDLASWAKNARLHAALTQAQLADLLGRTKGSVSQIENNGSAPSIETVQEIARITRYQLPWELGNVERVPVGVRQFPIVDYVQAGNWTEATDPYPIGGGDEVLTTDIECSSNAFALRIKGDSMTPDFREGDVVLIDPAVAWQAGDYVVAKNGGNEATFKKYRPRGLNSAGDDVYELVPLNDDYAPIRSDLEPVRIIGTMVEHRRYRKARA